MISAYLGELAALATAACWAFTAVFFSEAGRRLDSYRVNQIRLLFAVCIYTIALLLRFGHLFPPDLNAGQVWWLALSGVIGLVIGDGAGFKALVMIGPRLATLLWSTAPIMATVIAWLLLGERLNLFDYLGIVVTIAGVTWVVSERNARQRRVAADHPDAGTLVRGVMYGLLAAFGQAAGLVLSKQAMLYSGGALDAMPASFIRMLAAVAFIWGYSALRGHLRGTIAAMVPSRAMALTAAGATVGPFLGVWLSLVAVAMIPAGVAATLNATTPILILPVVRVVYGERITLRAALGAVVAFLGIVLLFASDELSRLF